MVLSAPPTISTALNTNTEAELQQYLDAYLNLPFEKVADPLIARDIVGLSAFFAWDFAKNALQSLNYIITDRLETPLRHEDTFANLLQLVSEECCTDNIRGPEYGKCSHLFPAFDAADAVGFDTRPLYKLLHDKDMGDLPASWQTFVHFQPKYLANRNGCFAILAHCRELLLNQVFDRLSKHLPDDPRFNQARIFFAKHVDIDTDADGGHMALINAILDDIITGHDEANVWACQFMAHRIQLYQAILNA